MLRLTCIVFFVLQSCAPIYDSIVKYKGPEGDSGKKCVIRCNYVKNSCYRQCQVDLTNCKLNEKRIDVQAYSEPFIKIVNNNSNNNQNDAKVIDNSSKDLCKNKFEQCKKSCNGDIICKSKCDFQMNTCYMNQNFNRGDDFGRFVSEFHKKNNDQVIGPQKSVSICRIDECEKLCESDYDLCFTDCGGEIVTYTQCVAFCNKK
ncbi:MAG: hypothetical protein ACTJLM_01185 [Ehrlichia sp.]